MEINPALIAAGAALMGTLVGVYVNQRATREAHDLLRQQLELARESFEADSTRAMTQTRHDLAELAARVSEGPHMRRLDESIDRHDAQSAWLAGLSSELRVLRQLIDRTKLQELGWDEPPQVLKVPALEVRGAYLDGVGVDFGSVIAYLAAVLQRYADLRSARDETGPLADDHRDRLWAVCGDIDGAARDAYKLTERERERHFRSTSDLKGRRQDAELTFAKGRRDRLKDLDSTDEPDSDDLTTEPPE